ncbi:MAG TPA: sulfatase [Solirubrobacteraceae bacterium]|nr:sulfatase [Solirubrobacteraceae bacterium]
MRRAVLALLLVAGVALGGSAAAGTFGGGRAAAAAHATARPDVVFILTDDLSWNLIDGRIAPHVMQLERRGETFDHYFVADSLCCPSRATIFTGLFPHDSGVVTNFPPFGGFEEFQARHLARRTFAVAAQRRGYRTSLLGKYLNGYGDRDMAAGRAPIPPGWTDWHVSNNTGYREFDYLLDENGRVNFYGGPTGACGVTGTPDNYGVDVLNARARAFIARSGRRPFLLEVATFAPHKPSTPAPRDGCDFPGLRQPRDSSFDTGNTDPPGWLGHRRPLTRREIRTLDKTYRKRARSVEAVDKLLADVEATLAARHLLDRTYIVFSSDNGYHMGQHRLMRGKQTAFETDIRVPLIVAGPGVPQGRRVSRVVQNVDLAPTFERIAGITPARSVDGHSLLPLLHPAGPPVRWRTVALVEHHGPDLNRSDPDYETGRRGGNPTTYQAIRISARRLPAFRGPVEALYVEYRDGAHEREYYDLRRDPFERHNAWHRLSRAQRRELHRVLARLRRCHGARACWAAGLPR